MNKIDYIKNDSHRTMEIILTCHEFTWNCPATQQPDFGTFIITYIPKERIIETKSFKLYLQQYRYRNSFAEELATRVLNDIVYYIIPEQITVEMIQNSRGGIQGTVKVKWHSEDGFDYVPKDNFRGGWKLVASGKK